MTEFLGRIKSEVFSNAATSHQHLIRRGLVPVNVKLDRAYDINHHRYFVKPELPPQPYPWISFLNPLGIFPDSIDEEQLSSYLRDYDFYGHAIDVALRKLLGNFALPKEAQQIDRVVAAFARRYHECNPTLFRSADETYAVAFSLLLLHTDAHNKHVKTKMTKNQYIRQTKLIEDGDKIPIEILDILYDNITYTEFTYLEDEFPIPQRMKSSHRLLSPTARSFSDSNLLQKRLKHTEEHLRTKVEQLIPEKDPFIRYTPSNITNLRRSFRTLRNISIAGVRSRQTQSPHHNAKDAERNTADKNGVGACENRLRAVKMSILEKKNDLSQGGTKATVRLWRPYGVALTAGQLVLFPDIETFKELTNGGETSAASMLRPSVILSIRDGFCVHDQSYHKHPHVFRFVERDGHEYLFRASDENEMRDWIIWINYGAACRTVGITFRSPHASPHKLVQEQHHDLAKHVSEYLESVQSKMSIHQEQLENEMRLRGNLCALIPLQKSTRDRMQHFIDTAATRIRRLRLTLAKLETYMDILTKELTILGQKRPIIRPQRSSSSSTATTSSQGSSHTKPSTDSNGWWSESQKRSDTSPLIPRPIRSNSGSRVHPLPSLDMRLLAPPLLRSPTTSSDTEYEIDSVVTPDACHMNFRDEASLLLRGDQDDVPEEDGAEESEK
ncbi:uncharacterized protein VTP21DRAFT_2638 [Calcarisporiella thermophila]|uniref:uncharacterized protein n=1 Tax=Calcarisporiella thermophila TaxID=911321 RepID=UPI0037440D41